MKLNFVERRAYVIPIVFILSLLIFMSARQLVADAYYRIAQHNGKERNKNIYYLKKSIAIDSKNALFHFSLGREYLHKGLAKATKANEKNKWVRKSIDEFHRAIELEPSGSDCHFHLGLSYGSLAYPPPFYWKVIQNSFKRTAILNPTDVRHLYSIGIYYINEYDRLKNIGSNTEKIGLDDYKNYLEMSKHNYQFFFKNLLGVDGDYLGKVLEKCFAVTQQYADLKAVIRDTANDHVFLAQFLNRKGMWKEAKEEFLVAINLEPANPILCSDFAHALFRRGDFEHAIHWWQKQKILNPRDKMAYLYLADGFVKLRRFDDALRELRDLITLYPGNINYQIKLIRTLLAAGRLDEAIGEYHEAMEKDPHFSKTMYDMIRHYQKKGNYPKAIKILNKALLLVLNR